MWILFYWSDFFAFGLIAYRLFLIIFDHVWSEIVFLLIFGPTRAIVVRFCRGLYVNSKLFISFGLSINFGLFFSFSFFLDLGYIQFLSFFLPLFIYLSYFCLPVLVCFEILSCLSFECYLPAVRCSSVLDYFMVGFLYIDGGTGDRVTRGQSKSLRIVGEVFTSQKWGRSICDAFRPYFEKVTNFCVRKCHM